MQRTPLISCAEIIKFVSNYYNLPSRLFRGKSEIKLQEGTTQGDSIAMGLFSPGITPLLSKFIPNNRGSISADTFHQIVVVDNFAGYGSPQT